MPSMPTPCPRRDPARRLARHLSVAASLFLAALPAAQAGPHADDLTRCLVDATTPADKSLLVQWMFAMMALHPDVSRLATVPAAQRTDLSRNVAGLFQKLLTRSCNTEARLALQVEGPAVFESSFNVLGQVAGRELFANPSVAAGLGDLTRHLDEKALQQALQERK